jgi:hypothetical protein
VIHSFPPVLIGSLITIAVASTGCSERVKYYLTVESTMVIIC